MLEPLEPFGVLWKTVVIPPIHKVLALLEKEKLVLIRGLKPLVREDFLQYCQSGSRTHDPCLHWDFGPVMELKVKDNSENYLFTNESVPFHWDGAFHQVPSVLVFNSIEAPPENTGGETLFCDTEKLLQKTSHEISRDWKNLQLTYRTEKKAHYGGEFTTPLISKHPKRDNTILRFAEEVKTEKNPVTLSSSGLEKEIADKAIQYLSHKIYEKEFCYEHQWKTGDLLFADNHALIHGRRKFLRSAARHLRRIQLV